MMRTKFYNYLTLNEVIKLRAMTSLYQTPKAIKTTEAEIKWRIALTKEI